MWRYGGGADVTRAATTACGADREEGQSFVEYAMVLALVAVAVAGAVAFAGTSFDATYSWLGNQVGAVVP
jgi:Flp pilus assembly pilin Flp